MGSVTASTRLTGVIGRPVRHSLSPVIHNAAFAALGLDWISVAFEVDEAGVPEALAGMRGLGLEGLSVTMPDKEAVIAHLDRLSSDAAELGAVNCVQRRGPELVGHNTDGPGFVDSLREDLAWDPHGTRCAVLGAGGAARAVIRALRVAGAAEIVVVGRTRGRAEVAAALARDVGRLGTTEDVAEVDLVVNATPVGMGNGAGALPLDTDLLGSRQLVVDLIYQPLETALVAVARARGIRAVNGVGMLVHQAAHQIELWTGAAAPIGEMRSAVDRELG